MKPGVRAGCGLLFAASVWAMPALSSGAAAVDVAVLQGLDKITARISTFEAPIDRPVAFGSLEIIARTCHKTPPEEPPESAAFLEVVDVRPDSEAVTLFTGWMFASSPAVSALEHAVYDVWVIDCVPGAPDAEVEKAEETDVDENDLTDAACSFSRSRLSTRRRKFCRAQDRFQFGSRLFISA